MASQKNKAGLVNRFLGHVLPGIIRPLHALWNEVIGFVFIVLATDAAPSAWRNVRSRRRQHREFRQGGGLRRFRAADGLFRHHFFPGARKISRS